MQQAVFSFVEQVNLGTLAPSDTSVISYFLYGYVGSTSELKHGLSALMPILGQSKIRFSGELQIKPKEVAD